MYTFICTCSSSLCVMWHVNMLILYVVNPSATNTITVGRTDDPTTPITITPTLSQSVKLYCDRSSTGKNWYTGDPRTVVRTTRGEIAVTPGPARTLHIFSFNPSHARGYTCTVNGGSSPTYPVILGELRTMFATLNLEGFQFRLTNAT